MPEHTSSHLELEHIALADRDLFSLFLRYPEMPQPIDEPQDQIDVAPHTALLTTSSPVSSPSSKFYSSPLPNLTRYETPTSSPLGPPDSVPLPDLPVAVNEEEVEELTTKFDASVKSDDVPNNTGDLMAEMKSMIVFMGTMLFSGRTGLSTDLENLWRVKSAADWLIQSLRHAEGVIQGEINAIETILQLAPFTVRPTPEDLWTNYKQMAELIVQHTTIPSGRELDLCEQLCHIYGACVYRPALAILPTQPHDQGLISLLDHLYHAIMTLPTRYRQWHRAMQHVGDNYTKPTMRRILNSPQVMKQILEFEQQKQVAAKSIVEMESATRSVLMALNAKSRRRQQQLSRREGWLLSRRWERPSVS